MISPTPTAPVPSVQVSGASQLRVGATTTFTAAVSNLTNTTVTWQVNGVAGGNSTFGTISSGGVYTPPAAVPTANTVTVSAVSVASPTVSGSAQLALLNPVPVLSAATATAVQAVGTSF